MTKLYNFIIWTNFILPFGCFSFCHLAIFYFSIWPFLLVDANKNRYNLLVVDNKFDKIPTLFRMVANVETKPFGTVFVQSWYYVKDTHRLTVLNILWEQQTLRLFCDRQTDPQ